MYCLNMLAIALELAKEDPAYEDVASKFFEHFVHIAHAMNDFGSDGISLWDEEDGFYYDLLHLPKRGRALPQSSLDGRLDPALRRRDSRAGNHRPFCPAFKRRMQWFIDNHPDVPEHIEMTQRSARGMRRLLSLVNRKHLKRIMSRMLDETEFLSDFGIRALSRYHNEHPYEVYVNGHVNRVDYEPAESSTGLFGGNLQLAWPGSGSL